MSHDEITLRETSNIIAVEKLCLDFKTKRSAYEKELTAFLEKNRTALSLEHAQDIVEAYIEKVWPYEMPGSLITSYDSFDGFHRFIFRPPVDGPLAIGFVANGQVPIFSAYRKQGTLVIDKCVLTAHIPPRPFERYVSGQIITVINGQRMQQSDFDSLLQLPKVQDKVNLLLQQWQDYLDWQEQLVFNRQIVLRYYKYGRTENGTVCFLVKDDEILNQLRRTRNVLMTIASLSDSQSSDSWQPYPNRKIKSIRIGQIIKTQSVNLDTLTFDIDDDSDLKDENLGVIIIQPEEGVNIDNISDDGFLLSSVAGDLKPISSARHTIQRFKKGQGHNPFLQYWLFDILNGATPTITSPIYKNTESFVPLNEAQRIAVEKATADIDIMVTHGPPGTGKTQSMSELCRRVCRLGQRVLVSSQANTAVDNIMKYLTNDPWIRMIRYGNPDRLEKDIQCFLKDGVLKEWLPVVRNVCLNQIQQRIESNEKLQQGSDALQRLSSIESQSEALTQQIKDCETHQQQLQHEQNTLSDKINALQQQIDQLDRRNKSLVELQEWLNNSNGSCPSSELISNESINNELEHLIRESRNVINIQSKILPPFLERRSQNQWIILEQLKNSISLSRNVEDLAEQAFKLTQLTKKEQKKLKIQWAELCRLLQIALINTYGTASFSNLDDLISSLIPSAKWSKLLNNLRTLCQTLTGPVQKLLTSGSYLLKEKMVAFNNKIIEQKEQYKQQLQQTLVEKEQLDTDESQINEQLISLQQQYSQIQQRWQEYWPAACPDLDSPTPAPLISKKAIEERKNQFQQWLEQAETQNEYQEIWDTIQRFWIKQLDLPGTAKNMDLLKLYVTNANIVGLTCLEAGQRSFYNSEYFKPFDIVIIDESSKATPLDLLMPMMLGNKVVLVGDHRQLPPMFKEKESSYTEALEDGTIKSEDFNRFEELITASYFEQLYTKAPDGNKQYLQVQYRSHKQIMDVTNIFYDGQLKCPDNIEEFHKTKEHNLTIYDRFGGKFLEPDRHVLWIDSSKTPSGKYFFEQQIGSSKANRLEVELIVANLKLLNEAVKKRGFQPPFKHQVSSSEHGINLQQWLRQKKPNTAAMTTEEMKECKLHINGHPASLETIVKENDKITADMRRPVAIITFYGAQLGAIRKRLKESRTQDPKQFDCLNIKTNTVDKFQGMEMPIVIVSMVRATRSNRLGQFVKEYRRINVAFSRAQKLLIIIGAARTFRDAQVDLPDINTGEIKKTPVYDTIYKIITENGERRYARTLIDKI